MVRDALAMGISKEIPEDITELLSRWSQGDETALEELMPIVYEELHQLAKQYMRRERPDHTLQATALVNEAFLGLLGAKSIDWQNRAHFIGIAARLMRRILVAHAREHLAQKRGGEVFKLPLSRADRVPFPRDVNLVALDEALKKLSSEYSRQAQVVELLFFGGLSIKETADVLIADGVNTSQRTVERDWSFAKSWLFREINQ
jgi:RNA polymerase sigma-70 factor, ECF subfamily